MLIHQRTLPVFSVPWQDIKIFSYQVSTVFMAAAVITVGPYRNQGPGWLASTEKRWWGWWRGHGSPSHVLDSTVKLLLLLLRRLASVHHHQLMVGGRTASVGNVGNTSARSRVSGRGHGAGEDVVQRLVHFRIRSQWTAPASGGCGRVCRWPSTWRARRVNPKIVYNKFINNPCP